MPTYQLKLLSGRSTSGWRERVVLYSAATTGKHVWTGKPLRRRYDKNMRSPFNATKTVLLINKYYTNYTIAQPQEIEAHSRDTNTHTRARPRSRTHTHTHTHVHTRTHARMHAQTHTYARTHTRAHARTHAHAHTHTHCSYSSHFAVIIIKVGHLLLRFTSLLLLFHNSQLLTLSHKFASSAYAPL